MSSSCPSVSHMMRQAGIACSYAARKAATRCKTPALVSGGGAAAEVAVSRVRGGGEIKRIRGDVLSEGGQVGINPNIKFCWVALRGGGNGHGGVGESAAAGTGTPPPCPRYTGKATRVSADSPYTSQIDPVHTHPRSSGGKIHRWRGIGRRQCPLPPSSKAGNVGNITGRKQNLVSWREAPRADSASGE